MLLRTIQMGNPEELSAAGASSAASTGFSRPSLVPAYVEDAVLAACLRAGRPQGEEGLLEVRGLGCPTVTAGSGRPVLCVHGLGHDAWDFAPFMLRCKSGARVTAFDLPGFGLADKSSAGGEHWGLDLHVQAVLAAASKMSAPPVVVASSLGGHIAILAALQSPQAFAKLVLVAPGGLVDVSIHVQSVLRSYYSVSSICTRTETEILGNSRRIFARPGSAVDDALAARKLAVHRSGRRREFAVPFAGVVDDVFRHVVIDRVGELRVPTLIMSGARDVVVPPDVCAEAARRIGCRFLAFPETGHCPHLETPDAFADVVLPFIHGVAS